MKLIKVIGLILLALIALKVGLIVLGLASALLFTLFWVAVLSVVGMVIWKLVSGSNKKKKSLTAANTNYFPEMEDAMSELKQQAQEFKRQVIKR